MLCSWESFKFLFLIYRNTIYLTHIHFMCVHSIFTCSIHSYHLWLHMIQSSNIQDLPEPSQLFHLYNAYYSLWLYIFLLGTASYVQLFFAAILALTKFISMGQRKQTFCVASLFLFWDVLHSVCWCMKLEVMHTFVTYTQ